MSENQYYEFQAIDRTLTAKEIAELRACSTRAHITSTSFTNDYAWGNFKGNENAWMEKYFDAFLYLANWGTHILRFRLPSGQLGLTTAKAYCDGSGASVRAKAGKVILRFESEDGHDGSSLVVISVDRFPSKPFRRTLNLESVFAGDGAGKDVFSQLVLSDHQEAMSSLLQLGGPTSRRKGDNDALGREKRPNALDGRGEIAISRHQNGCIKTVLECIFKQLGRNIYVSHFFFMTHPRRSTAEALHPLWKIMPEMGCEPCPGCQRLKPKSLSARALADPAGTHTGREVMAMHQFLTWFDQRLWDCNQVEPIVFAPILGFKPKIEVETIDVTYHP